MTDEQKALLERLRTDVRAAFDREDFWKEQTPEEQEQAITRILQDHLKSCGLHDYKVICDETNNGPEDIASGQLNVDIFIPVDWVFRRVNDPNIDPHDRLMLLDTLEAQGFLNILPMKK